MARSNRNPGSRRAEAQRFSDEDRAALLELGRVVKTRTYFRTRDESGSFWDAVERCFRPSDVERRRGIPPLDSKDGPVVPIAANICGDVLALAIGGPKRGQVLFVNHEYNPGQRYRLIKVAPSLRAFVRDLRESPEDELDGAERSDAEFTALLDAIAANPDRIGDVIRQATRRKDQKPRRK